MKVKLAMMIALLCLAPAALADEKNTAPAPKKEADKPAEAASASKAIPPERFEQIRLLAVARHSAQQLYDFAAQSIFLDKSSGCAQQILRGLQQGVELAEARLELALAEAREEFKIPRGYLPNYQQGVFNPPPAKTQ